MRILSRGRISLIACLLILSTGVTGPARAQGQRESAEQILFDAANRDRAAQRLRPLRWDNSLANGARQHAQRMAHPICRDNAKARSKFCSMLRIATARRKGCGRCEGTILSQRGPASLPIAWLNRTLFRINFPARKTSKRGQFAPVLVSARLRKISPKARTRPASTFSG